MKKTVFTGAATALITPLTRDGIDYEQFGRLIDWQIAEGVNFVIGVALYFFDNQLSDGAFVPRNAVCHAEPFEQRNINHGTHLRS